MGKAWRESVQQSAARPPQCALRRLPEEYTPTQCVCQGGDGIQQSVYHTQCGADAALGEWRLQSHALARRISGHNLSRNGYAARFHDAPVCPCQSSFPSVQAKAALRQRAHNPSAVAHAACEPGKRRPAAQQAEEIAVHCPKRAEQGRTRSQAVGETVCTM